MFCVIIDVIAFDHIGGIPLQLQHSQGANLGQDKISRLLFQLALPAILAQLINLLYNMVDRMYIGHIPDVGPNALTGVGVTLPLIMCISAFAALVSMGGAPRASIMMGKGEPQQAERILGNCASMLVITALVLTVVIQCFGQDILMIFGASSNTISYAWDYMKIYSLGTLFVQLALGLNAFINAQGFGRKGMMTVLLGAVTNIVLDLLFVVGFHWGVFGVAIATALSQVVSAALVLFVLLQPACVYTLVPKEVRFYPGTLKNILRIGVPAGIQSDMYAVSNILLQSCINAFGTDTVAAYTAFGKVDGFYWMISGAFGVAITTFVSQNFGAQKYDRLRRSVRVCLGLTFGVTAFVSLVFFAAAPWLLRMFSGDTTVISLGVGMLRFICPFYCTFVCIEIFSGTVRGTGDSLPPMLLTCGGVCVLRVLWVFLILPHYPSMDTVLVSYPVSWVVTSLLYILYYLQGGWLRRRIRVYGYVPEECGRKPAKV